MSLPEPALALRALTTPNCLDLALLFVRRHFRLIAAGWLSLHATLYVVAALMLAGLLATATRWFVRHVGRRT